MMILALTLVVSAAASLTEALQQLAAAYEQRTGEAVVLNLAASNTLARQIRSGAPVDVFISADEAQMDAVAALVVPGSRVELLSNQLVVAVPDDRSGRLASIRDLMAPPIRRIAIGDPAAVPAGVYARAYLEHVGLWDAISPRIVPMGSVRMALAAVETGVADAAIVYRTDMATARRARQAFAVPLDEGPRIVYPAAAMRGGNAPGAKRWLDFLRSPEAAAVFERLGFIPLASRPAA